MALVWVPVIGRGTEEDPQRPDVPDGIRWHAAAIPVEVRQGHRERGRPITGLCRVEVADADVSKVTTSQVPTVRDEAIIKVWLLAGNRDAVLAEISKLRERYAGLGPLPETARDALVEAVDVLVQRAYLSDTDAANIIKSNGLEPVAVTEGIE